MNFVLLFTLGFLVVHLVGSSPMPLGRLQAEGQEPVMVLPEAPLPRTSTPRRLTVDDLLILQTVDEIVSSPDGEWLAATIIRGMTEHERYGRRSLLGLSRADIWLIPTNGGDPRNLTQGLQDGSGYWSPVWSPDSRRLVVLSTAGSGNVRPFLIDRRTGEIRPLSARGVDLQLNAGMGDARRSRAIAWANDSTILCSLLPEGEVPVSLIRANPEFYAAERITSWQQAQAGRVPTRSVLDAGVAVGKEALAARELVAIDVLTGQAKVLAEGRFTSITIDADGRQIAVTQATGVIQPSRVRLLSFGGYTADGRAIPRHGRLGIIGLSSGGQVKWVEGPIDPEPYDHARIARWSEDGKWLAVVAKERLEGGSTSKVFIVSAETGRSMRVGPATFRALSIVWSGSWLLIRGETLGSTSDRSVEPDWWVWDSRYPNRDLRRVRTDAFGGPERLWRLHGMGGLVGVASGDLWLIQPQAATMTKLTGSFAPAIESIVWPSSHHERLGALSRSVRVLVSARSGGSLRLYRIDLQKLKHARVEAYAEAISSPHPDAQISAYVARTNAATFLLAGPTGTFLWTGPAYGEAHHSNRLSLNEHLGGIAEAERRIFTYQGGDGQVLRGTLTLPVGYQAGRRYPLITNVYLGSIADEDGHRESRKEYPYPQHNLQLFASRGYAVLQPSIPLPPGTNAIDPFIEITKHVLPAVDKVIEMGIADPNRLAVHGHSYGSYAALALVTQSRRFQAAAVSAVYSDLLAYYTQFDPGYRSLSWVHEHHLNRWAELEGPYTMRLRVVPWDDLYRYLRNSPLASLNRIQTPLLMLHGELDGVPITQSEAIFTGLFRLGRRVRLVRYWGEGHNLDSPANIRDSWDQVLTWFDEHLNR